MNSWNLEEVGQAKQLRVSIKKENVAAFQEELWKVFHPEAAGIMDDRRFSN